MVSAADLDLDPEAAMAPAMGEAAVPTTALLTMEEAAMAPPTMVEVAAAPLDLIIITTTTALQVMVAAMGAPMDDKHLVSIIPNCYQFF
jgi:hypothetical protein